MSARSHKASRSEQPTERCACGHMPGHHVQVAGDVRLFFIACSCGSTTQKSESWLDVLGEWNDKQLAERSGTDGTNRTNAAA